MSNSFASVQRVAAAAAAVALTAAGARRRYFRRGRHLPVSHLFEMGRCVQDQQTGIGLNYQSIGSGGGIKQIKAKTVTFGASDMPLKPEELKAAGLVQFPMIIGGVVPVVNVKGVGPGQLTLDGATLAAIYLGDITSGTTRAIKKLNPKLALPATAIAPVYRSDGSGTNFLFTDYLSKSEPEVQGQHRRRDLGAVAGRHRRQGQ